MSRPRAVLDTNVVVSALLFRGELLRLHILWKKRAFLPLASSEIVEEYLRVLAYPKFELTEGDIQDLLREELLPYLEPVRVPKGLDPTCDDPDDAKFLACAETARAGALVSGDAALLRLKKHRGCPILPPERFLRRFK